MQFFEDILKFEDIPINLMKAFIIAAVSHPYFKVRWLPSIYRKVCEDVFDAEVNRLNETNSISESTAMASSAGDYYGLYEPGSGSNDSSFTVEAVQYLNYPSHDMNQLSRYPAVKKVFLKFNTTIPSSAPVERQSSWSYTDSSA